MSLLLTLRTARHLKWRQIASRLTRRFVRLRPDCRLAPKRRAFPASLIEPVRSEPAMLGPIRFRFLNCEGKLRSPESWNDPARERLWTYHLHYFDDLTARDAPARAEWHRLLLSCWIRENPQFIGAGWEPYPASLRIVNWVQWALAGGLLDADALQSLAAQVRSLPPRLETHLLGNHLLANAKALCFGGLFFQGAEAEGWLRLGLSILRAEFAEQILPDGGHLERSPLYHALVLEDLLDLLALFRAAGREDLFLWADAVARMRAWLGALTHPDGEIALLNDAAFGAAPHPGELEEYAARLGLPPRHEPSEPLLSLADTGYLRLRRGRAVLFADAAPLGPDYLPGHGHADTLTFEFSLDDHRVVVDSGVSTYEPGPERLRQRGTDAHNTLSVDGADSSEVWESFRVARRARIVGLRTESHPDRLWAQASHNGYQRLRGVGLHTRSWSLADDQLEIRDELAGQNHRRLRLSFHLHPQVRLVPLDERLFSLQRPAGREIATIAVDPALAPRVVDTTYHPEFGLAQPSQALVAEAAQSLPARFVTRFAWSASRPLSPGAEA